MSDGATGVSFLVPVRNGGRWIGEVLDAIASAADGRPMEILVIDDGSTDGSGRILDERATAGRIRLLRGEGRGAAAALNLGLAACRHPLVAQVDQDVVLGPGWLGPMAAALESRELAAVHGRYLAAPGAPLVARVAGLDHALRYEGLAGGPLDHVGSGNTLYRREALAGIGGFDESLGYGYDNDASYRLIEKGWALGFVPEAGAVHHFRGDLAGYLRQQYGLGYGRLELVARHPGRIAGDRLSGLRMILHVPIMAALLAAGSTSVALVAAGSHHAGATALLAGLLLAGLALDRAAASVEAWLRFRDPAAFAFVPVHLARDVAWVAATVAWGARRLFGIPSRPSHSMRSHP